MGMAAILALILYECKQNKMKLVFLPVHTSYGLQPLKLSCYSPIKIKDQILPLVDLGPQKWARRVGPGLEMADTDGHGHMNSPTGGV